MSTGFYIHKNGQLLEQCRALGNLSCAYDDRGRGDSENCRRKPTLKAVLLLAADTATGKQYFTSDPIRFGDAHKVNGVGGILDTANTA